MVLKLGDAQLNRETSFFYRYMYRCHPDSLRTTALRDDALRDTYSVQYDSLQVKVTHHGKSVFDFINSIVAITGMPNALVHFPVLCFLEK